jgi:membrane-associated phospholipid phosphatase
MHHMAFPLYGGGLPDVAICIALATSTVTLGTLRVVSDKHWPTDVVTGGILGSAIGFGLPYFVHYRTREPLSAALLPPNMAFVPMLRDDAWGLSIAGFL